MPFAHDNRFSTCSTDQEAFDRISTRLKFDVGNVVDYYLNTIQPGDPVGFWAFLRMLFPVAESLGDLLYRKTPSKNLINIFEKDLSEYNPRYKQISAILTCLYRHSLIHQDEMRMIDYDQKWIFWSITFNLPNKHLELEFLKKKAPGILYINFDITKFYDDILQICEDKRNVDYGGKVADRYNQWQSFSLLDQKDNFTTQRTKGQITDLFK